MSANKIETETEFDKKVINFCEEIGDVLSSSIKPENFDEQLFKKVKSAKNYKYNKKKHKKNSTEEKNKIIKENPEYIKYLEFFEISRAKPRSKLAFGPNILQQNALATRGKGGKSPFSNRNHRWHPLVAAKNQVREFELIEKITTGEETFYKKKEKKSFKSKTLIFHIKQNGKVEEFKSSETFKIIGKFVVTKEKWEPIIEELKEWDKTQWEYAKCLIPASEACSWYNAVESFCILGIIKGVKNFGANLDYLIEKISEKLQNQDIDNSIELPTNNFTKKLNDPNLFKCIICKKDVNESLKEFRSSERADSWKPEWTKNKTKEGEDDSLQITHLKPLVEQEERHNALNCSYGHRWCNVAMTDHNLEESLKLFKHVVKVHDES